MSRAPTATIDTGDLQPIEGLGSVDVLDHPDVEDLEVRWRDSEPLPATEPAEMPSGHEVVLHRTDVADYVGVLLLPPIEVLREVPEERDDIVTLEDIERIRIERLRAEEEARTEYMWDRLRYEVNRLDLQPTADHSDLATRQEIRIYPELDDLEEELTGEIDIYTPPPQEHDTAIEVHEASPVPAIVEDERSLHEQMLEKAQVIADAVDSLVSRLSVTPDELVITHRRNGDPEDIVITHRNREWEESVMAVSADSALYYREDEDYDLLEAAEQSVAQMGRLPRLPEDDAENEWLLRPEQVADAMAMAEPHRRLLNFARKHLPGLIEEDLDLRRKATECFVQEMVPLNQLHTELRELFKDQHWPDGHPYYPRQIKHLWSLYIAVRDLETSDLGIVLYERKVNKFMKSSRLHPTIKQDVVNRVHKHIKNMEKRALEAGGQDGDD